MVTRLAQQGTALIAAAINVGILFDILEWTNEQTAGVNLTAGLLWTILFGAQARAADA